MATSPPPAPPQIQLAQERFARAVAQVEKREVDLLKASWEEIEKAVIKLLGGAFQVQRPEHQEIALGVGAVFAARMAAEHGAFWFPQRDTMEGAALGFPDALVPPISPLRLALDALTHSRLQRLEDLAGELRKSLAAAKFSISGSGGAVRLRPEDYMRLFDAGFIQLTALDPAKAKQLWEGTPAAAARELRDALGRATKLHPEARKQLDSDLGGALSRLNPQKPIQEQPEAAGLSDILGHLFASREHTNIAREELWRELALPLVMIGAPQQFPPLEPEDVEEYAAGAPVMALYVDVVPYTTPSADEDGLLGVIPVADLQLPASAASRVAPPRLIKVKPDALRALFKSFDLAKAKDALQRFDKYLEQKAGKKGPDSEQGRHIEKAAFTLVEDAARVLAAVDKGADLYVRRLTGAEAEMEPELSLVRDALQGPRIILA